jgi:hypothetical protein
VPDEPRSAEAAREAPDVATWPVLATVVGFMVFVGVSLVALRVYYASDVRGPVVVPPRPYPSPELQVDPTADLDRLQAEQRGRLTGYAWVDRDHGLARIPIDRAMELIAGRSVDAYAPLGPPPEASSLPVPGRQP